MIVTGYILAVVAFTAIVLGLFLVETILVNILPLPGKEDYGIMVVKGELKEYHSHVVVHGIMAIISTYLGLWACQGIVGAFDVQMGLVFFGILMFFRIATSCSSPPLWIIPEIIGGIAGGCAFLFRHLL